MILGIIPSRYASSRFPAKALADIDGKTMIRRVYEQASKAKKLDEIVVATDHEAIVEEVKSFGGNVVMTSENHQSGTDRCYEAYQNFEQKGAEYVVNIQGDEPYLYPEQIDELVDVLQAKNAEIATLIKKIESNQELLNFSEVKVIYNNQNEAIYFSRWPIPFYRGVEESQWYHHLDYYKHIGIYGFRTDILAKICELQPSKLEKAESLEQLRWIENGFKVSLGFTEYESYCVDTPEDLKITLAKMKGK
ncbi:3-deoxy-manno-octulosonate cytidylyltransferase [Rapidithrix thailandica]|uniref:3-deoxy-manno-octulosonate cytidylyltransferase n=1 Tax=Rapidithrix thailandica TaxID=413964 RepID=A0AAW9S5X5_9BACT